MTERRTEKAADGAMQALEDLLDAYGADPARWPGEDPRRAAAWALIESGDAAALQSLAAAAALDSALDSATPPAPSAALTGAVLQAAQRTGSGLPGRFGLLLNPAFFRPAGALACAMLLGLAVGSWSPVPIVGVDESQVAGLETEMASLGTLDGNGDDNGFGEFAR